MDREAPSIAMATSNTGATGDDAETLPAAVIEDLLACEHRRTLLSVLHERDGPVPIGDLARELAPGSDADRVSDSDRRAARTEIYQAHLPKLTATGVVHFDSLLGEVELAAVPALVARLDAET
jgi:hypothetical protein